MKPDLATLYADLDRALRAMRDTPMPQPVIPLATDAELDDEFFDTGASHDA